MSRWRAAVHLSAGEERSLFMAATGANWSVRFEAKTGADGDSDSFVAISGSRSQTGRSCNSAQIRAARQSGQTISECLPHLAEIDELHAGREDGRLNHGPAKFFYTARPLWSAEHGADHIRHV
jgi:hypothetical protein